MSKEITIIRNAVGGIDLLTEKDAGNEVLIVTGAREHSQEFWATMARMARQALYEMHKDEETDDDGQTGVPACAHEIVKPANIDDIDELVTLGKALTEEDREFLYACIFRTHFKDDDPKYDDSNRNWLESLTDRELLDKYYS